MKRKNPSILESIILEVQDDLFYQLVNEGEVYIDGQYVTIFSMLEEIGDEEIHNVLSALIRGNDEAKEIAHEMMWQEFRSTFDEEVIEAHIILEGEEY